MYIFSVRKIKCIELQNINMCITTHMHILHHPWRGYPSQILACSKMFHHRSWYNVATVQFWHQSTQFSHQVWSTKFSSSSGCLSKKCCAGSDSKTCLTGPFLLNVWLILVWFSEHHSRHCMCYIALYYISFSILWCCALDHTFFCWFFS